MAVFTSLTDALYLITRQFRWHHHVISRRGSDASTRGTLSACPQTSDSPRGTAGEQQGTQCYQPAPSLPGSRRRRAYASWDRRCSSPEQTQCVPTDRLLHQQHWITDFADHQAEERAGKLDNSPMFVDEPSERS